jgi:hypothetical protein
LIKNPPLKQEYFDWLVTKVGGFRYLALCEHLYNTDFNWLIPNDDNREEDGKMLRLEFLDEFERYSENDFKRLFHDRCTMFELVLGVAVRLSYDSDIDFDVWFWELMENLKLEKYKDSFYNPNEIEKILNTFNERKYKKNGDGGLFPLKADSKDQRDVEIWYQMQAYL